MWHVSQTFVFVCESRLIFTRSHTHFYRCYQNYNVCLVSRSKFQNIGKVLLFPLHFLLPRGDERSFFFRLSILPAYFCLLYHQSCQLWIVAAGCDVHRTVNFRPHQPSAYAYALQRPLLDEKRSN